MAKGVTEEMGAPPEAGSLPADGDRGLTTLVVEPMKPPSARQTRDLRLAMRGAATCAQSSCELPRDTKAKVGGYCMVRFHLHRHARFVRHWTVLNQHCKRFV